MHSNKVDPNVDTFESKQSKDEDLKSQEQLSTLDQPEKHDGHENLNRLQRLVAYFRKPKAPENVERGNWNNRLEFVLSCAGYAIGLGNVWRFPRMVFKHGGGSFLIAYLFILVMLAFPVFFLELSVGQFTSQGPVMLFRRLMPAGEGLGWCTLAGQTLTSIYYSGIMSWSFYYMFSSFNIPMPWQTCTNPWNNNDCVAIPEWFECQGKTGARTNNTYFYHRRCYNETDIMDIFENADKCMQSMKIKEDNKTRKQVWQNDEKCRVDITFKFEKDGIKSFLDSNEFIDWFDPNMNENKTGVSIAAMESKLSIFSVSINNFKNRTNLTEGLSYSNYLHLNLAGGGSWSDNWYTFVMKHSNRTITKLMTQYCKYANETNLLRCVNKTLNQFDNMSHYASDQFFSDSIDHKDASFTHMMGVKWELGLSLVLTWVIMAVSLANGPKIMGRIVYFTATFPVVMILIFLIYSALLDGAKDGYRYYLKTDYSKLGDFDMWHAAAGQIFFSLSVGGGGLMTLASYNHFNNNLLVDAIIVASANCVTSFVAGFSIFAILGYMAKTLDKDIADVVPSGSTSLAFIGYAHATSVMPVSNLWAFLFFLMLIILAIDSEFALVETINTFLFDEFPVLRNHRYKTVSCCAFFCFLLALPGVSKYGSGVITIVDTAVNDYLILFVTILEIVLIVYVYGVKSFVKDIYMMLGKKDGTQRILFNKFSKWYYIVTWLLCPFLVFTLMIYTWTTYAKKGGIGNYLEIREDKMHPLIYLIFFLMAIGLFLCLTPGFFIYNKFYKRYTWREMFKPLPTWGPSLDINRWGNYEPLGEIAAKTVKAEEEKTE